MFAIILLLLFIFRKPPNVTIRYKTKEKELFCGKFVVVFVDVNHRFFIVMIK